MAERERERLREIVDDWSGWRRWGPYVSDRSWATVREDYSADGDAWDFLPHDLARSKAYRWGEDGIAGICDRYQLLVFAPAFWNGRDPILKERLFGLTPERGQPRRGRQGVLLLPRQHADALLHEVPLQVPAGRVPLRPADRGEPAGERPPGRSSSCSTPASSTTTATSTSSSSTPRPTPEDIVHPDRGVQPRARAGAAAHPAAPLVPQHLGLGRAPGPRAAHPPRAGGGRVPQPDGRRLGGRAAQRNLPFDYRLGPRYLYAPSRRRAALHRQRDERAARLRPGAPEPQAVRQGRLPPPRHRRRAVRRTRTRSAPRPRIHYRFDAVPAGRLGRASACGCRRGRPGRPAGRRRRDRSRSARPRPTSSTTAIHPPEASRRRAAGPAPGARRPALDASRSTSSTSAVWLDGDNPDLPPPASREAIRNQHWRHLNSMRVLSMPDKWEYPWFAAWDLAFHCVAARPGRPGVRQGAALGPALRAVPAPQRPDPRLRVGVLRPQPAGARLGGLAGLQHGPHPHRARPTASSWRSASTSC